MESLIKIAILLVFFLLLKFIPFSPKTTVLASVILLLFSLFIDVIFIHIDLLHYFSKMTVLMASGSMMGLIFRNKGKNMQKREKWVYFYYLIFLILIIGHSFFDFFAPYTTAMKETVANANAMGLLISFIFLFCFNSNVFLNYTSDKLFARIIVIASSILFVLLLLIKWNLLEGNTDKYSSGEGGLGLARISTNETALLSVCFLIFLLHFLKEHRSSKVFYAIAAILNVAVIIFTQSRMGIVSLLFITGLFFFSVARKNSLVLALITFLVIALTIPFISTMIKKRAENRDVHIAPGSIADNLGFTVSGRIVIWEEYLTQFFNNIEEHPSTLYFGAGFKKLVEMHDDTFLPQMGMIVEGLEFFPLHSDLVFIFITTGICGLILWLLIIKNIVVCQIKNPKFIVAAFMVVIISYSCFDMLIYSPLNSLLIGLGISFKKSS